ncbi:MAG: tetratricopeptide repeat protein [PS1 clade bacterium]|nr:tetratricopeptide repeat protein [PS1 clade bacterium]MBL6784175.1 tetratricopeptide repeat protein [PS1 clade bacterium]
MLAIVCLNTQQAISQSVKDKLFADPTNIEINLAYLQEQLAGRNFKGAAATLQRVLLLDSDSKLAKVLYAEVQLRLGNLADARLILRELLADKSLSQDMRLRAQALSDALEASQKRLTVSGSMGLAGGSADNALAAPKGPKVLFFDALYDSTSPEVVEAFVDYDAGLSLSYKLPTYRERGLTAGFGVAGRDYLEVNMADSTTGFVSFGITEKRKNPWSLNYNAFVTDVSGHVYNAGHQLALGVSTNLPDNARLSTTLRASETRHFSYLGSAASKQRDNYVTGLSVAYARPITGLPIPLLVTASLGGDVSSAEVDYYSTQSGSVSVGARTQLGGMSVSVAADFLSTEFDAADPLIGSDTRQDERSRASFGLGYALPPHLGGVEVTLSGFIANTRSNIVNFTKTLSELKIGLRKSF